MRSTRPLRSLGRRKAASVNAGVGLIKIKQGAIDCSMLTAISLLVAIGVGFLLDADQGAQTGSLVFIAGAVYIGSNYRRKYGPMFLSSDGTAFKNLFSYSLGYGIVAGLPLSIVSLVVGEKVHLATTVLLAFLAISFFAMNIIGALALGRFLNRSLDE